MMYPSIYSLSTVGILKHYNHDYLFHHKRTDFIGPNGVGKSILADLLQMMFVYEKELIKFGTEDVNGKREIHKLPYGTGCAYCFLNVAVQENRFITIGIQIHNQERKRIVPFVVSKDADLNLGITQLALNADELLFANDFIKNGTIPDIQDLADFFNSEQNLKLVFFKNKESVQEYYSFLSSKEILPINLSKEKNLKAFAKVIQSFSKAKTLKLSGNDASKSLKEFLFEDSDEIIKATFDKEKYELEKILKEYKRLNDEISLWNSKQKRLIGLQQQDKYSSNLFKDYKTVEIGNCYRALQTGKLLEVEGSQQRQEQQLSFDKLKNTIAKIPLVENIIKRRHAEAEKNYDQVYRYKQLTERIDELTETISELRMIVLPIIDEDWKAVVEKIDMSTRDLNQIKKSISFSEPFIKKYKTIQNIELTRKLQLDELNKLRALIDTEKSQKEALLNLLNDNHANSLIHWYISNLPAIDANQMQAVLYFATLPINKIESPTNKARFVHPNELDDLEITTTPTGIWLKSGALSEFVANNPDAERLMNRSDLKQQVEQLTSKLNYEINELNLKESALNNIRDGLEYDRNLFGFSFDPYISEASQIKTLKTAIACILQVSEKIFSLQIEKVNHENELMNLQQQFNVKYNEPDVVERNLKALKSLWLSRMNKMSKYSGSITAELKLLEKGIENATNDLFKITANNTKLQAEYDQLHKDYYEQFRENIMEFPEHVKDIKSLKKEHEEAYEAFKRAYIETVSVYEETKDEKNTEVNYELQNNSYSFSVLERALLGNKVKTTDDITTALQEANNNRTQIADGIRDSMIKIFTKTAEGYETYKTQIQTINTFFVDRKISGKFYFNVRFQENPEISINHLNEMAYAVRLSATRGELQFDQSITEFLEEFFRKLAKLKQTMPIAKLLDPKNYFNLSARLEDQYGDEIPGSTGESYSAIALLGIARLSTQKMRQKGLRFIILEELGSIDNTNFNIFPAIADEFQYQIITMAPHTFNIGLADEWYAHHLIKGKQDEKINFHPSSSYFKTRDANEALAIYINRATK